MSRNTNYPESHGRYERSELVRARFRLTIVERNTRRLSLDLLDLQDEAAMLTKRIAELEAAEGKR